MKRSTREASINMFPASSNHFLLNMQIFFLISLFFQETLQFSGTEQSILLSLKQHWRDSEFLQSWNLNSSVCTWSGVSCLDDRVVTQLNLGEKNITGTVPSTIICELNNLTFIDLSNNNISGTIPLSMKDCSMLQHLDLSKNSLSGQIPGELFGMKQLLNLYLNGNMLSGEMPKQISSQLENLDLSENHLNGSIPEDIGNFKNLLKLDLSHNSLSGSITSKLFQLHDLRHLSLSSNYLSSVIPFFIEFTLSYYFCPHLMILAADTQRTFKNSKHSQIPTDTTSTELHRTIHREKIYQNKERET
uniref:Serine-threonine protein kinase, plant-type n=1 Tax=Solanum tuberosum TaxID=4113 RepID=M1CYE4_SOLTU